MNQNSKESLWTPNFIKLSLANLLMATAFYFLIPSLPIYFTEVLKQKGSTIGLLLAAYTFAAVLTRPFVGYILDTFGRKWLFLLSFFFFSLLFNFYFFAITFILMLCLRLMHGLTWGTITVSNSTIVIDQLPPSRRGEGIGIYGLSMTLAMALGPIIGIFIYTHFGFNAMFLVSSVLSFMGLFVALQVKYPKFIRSKEPTKMQFNKLYEASVLPISFGLMLVLIPYGGLMSFIAVYSKEISLAQTGNFFMILAIGIGISRFLSGKIFDKNGPDKLIFYSTLLFIIGFLILANVKTLVGYYSSALLLGFANGIVFPSFQTMVNNVITMKRRGAANSTLLTFLDFGIGGGMILMGYVYQKFNLTAVFNLSALICLIAWFYYLGFIKFSYKKLKQKFDNDQSLSNSKSSNN